MGNKDTGLKFDVIVIGSGIGGLACACALTRMGHKVLVLERHFVAWTDWAVFAPWAESRLGHRPPDYAALKRLIEERLLAQFARHFPALAPMIVAREVSTPLTSVAFTGAVHGGVYGLEASPRRFFSDSLRARTPVPGLFLTGQDVSSAGITGAMMGGVIAAAALEPRVMSHVPLR